MPSQKISELTDLPSLDTADVLPIVDNSTTTTKKVSIATLDARYIPTVGVTYFGDPNTDGSFRIYLDAPNLKIQVRISGVWTTRDTITPT